MGGKLARTHVLVRNRAERWGKRLRSSLWPTMKSGRVARKRRSAFYRLSSARCILMLPWDFLESSIFVRSFWAASVSGTADKVRDAMLHSWLCDISQNETSTVVQYKQHTYPWCQQRGVLFLPCLSDCVYGIAGTFSTQINSLSGATIVSPRVTSVAREGGV